MNDTNEKTGWDYLAVVMIFGYLAAILLAIILHISAKSNERGMTIGNTYGLVCLFLSFVVWGISLWFLIFSEDVQASKHKRLMQNGKEHAGYYTEDNEFRVQSRLISANNIMGWSLQLVSVAFLIWSYVVYIKF